MVSLSDRSGTTILLTGETVSVTSTDNIDRVTSTDNVDRVNRWEFVTITNGSDGCWVVTDLKKQAALLEKEAAKRYWKDIQDFHSRGYYNVKLEPKRIKPYIRNTIKNERYG